MRSEAEALARALVAHAERSLFSSSCATTPNGVLIVNSSHEAVRIHIWSSMWAPWRDCDEWPHDHAAFICSRIMAGAVKNRTYEIALGSPEMQLYAWTKEPKPEWRKDALEPVRLADTVVYERGQTYSLRPGELHSSSATEGTVTVFSYLDEIGSVRFLAPLDDPDPAAFPGFRLATNVQRDHARRLLRQALK